MSKIDHYRQELKKLEKWDSFLLKESNLPGPRANLELAFAVAEEGSADLLLRYASLNTEEASANTPEEFLVVCGVIGLGYLVARGEVDHLPLIRANARDDRWRIREAVALGLQRFGQVDMDGLLDTMQTWIDGGHLERRAVVAALCEPNLLRSKERAIRVLDMLDEITSSIIETKDRKSDDFKVLRKGLGYGWSVVVAVQPSIGIPRFEKWVGVDDPDVRWIMKQNLKKNRLSRMDEAWVQSQLDRIRESQETKVLGEK